MTFQTEFPDFPAADFPAIPDGFEDVSWRNDACPCIVSDALGLQIFIDYTDTESREFPDTKRFTVSNQEAGVEVGMEGFDTDDWNEVLAFIEKRRFERSAAVGS